MLGGGVKSRLQVNVIGLQEAWNGQSHDAARPATQPPPNCLHEACSYAKSLRYLRSCMPIGVA